MEVNQNLSSQNIRDNFLKLFITQIKNQDPINPINNSDFTAQLAQLAQLERLEEIRKTNTDILNIFSSFLIGFKVVGIDSSGNEIESTITGITTTKDGPIIHTINGLIHSKQIKQIYKN